MKVDFEHDDDHKTYTVEAKAGDFIIGEVGRINISNGQTQEVGEPHQYSPESPSPGSEVHGPGRPGVAEENSSGGQTTSHSDHCIDFTDIGEIFWGPVSQLRKDAVASL